MVAVPPAATVVVDGAPAANAAASVPPSVGVLSVTALASTFLIVIVCERVSPGAADPKLTLDGEAVSTMFCGVARCDQLQSRWRCRSVSWSVTAAPPGFRS